MEIEIPKSPLKTPERDPVQELFRRPRVDLGDFIQAPSFRRGPNRPGQGRKLILFSWMASIIDIFVGLAMSLLSMAAMALFLKTPFVQVLTFFDGSLSRLAVVSFILIVGFYKVCLRSFFGFTLGEWACGLRMGSPEDQRKDHYALMVLLRAVVVFGSGVLVLPFISMLAGFDVAGRISGLYLYQLTNSNGSGARPRG